MGGKRVLALVVLGVFACARPADAGWLDFIWEMTGPRMIGIGGQCERSLKRDGEWRCILPLIGQPRPGGRAPADDWFWVSAESYYYFSTAGNGFKTGGVQGFGFDPMLSLSRTSTKGVRVSGGVGLTWQRFWSSDFDAFGNAGFKFKPIAVEFPIPISTARASVAYNLRYYWDGFESAPPVLRKKAAAETVHGLVISFTF